ncbi:membrane hypothetical protein [Desulfovibrionales bacterium]
MPYAAVMVKYTGRLLFVGFFIWCLLLGQLFQPKAHYFYDGLAIRDTALLWNLLTGIGGVKKFIIHAFAHVEGPIQFGLLNIYASLVGYFVSLDPAVMQLPNVFIASMAGLTLYRLGCLLRGPVYGAACVFLLATSPWFLSCLRTPWYFNLLTFLFQTAMVYWLLKAYWGGRSWDFWLTGLAFSLYFLGGMDWPLFFFFLSLWLLPALREFRARHLLYLAIPLAILCVEVGWTIWLLTRTRLSWINSILLHPFAMGQGHLYLSWRFLSTFFKNTLCGFGIPGVMAGWTIWSGKNMVLTVLINRFKWPHWICLTMGTLAQRLLPALAAWFCITVLATAITSLNMQYVYVAGLPTCLLGGLALERLARCRRIIIMTVTATTGLLLCLAWWNPSPLYLPDADRREVLAAACWLIDERPDLLSEFKVGFTARGWPAAVSRYTRGGHTLIVPPKEYTYFTNPNYRIPLTDYTASSLAFFLDYKRKDIISADWIVLDEHVFSSDYAHLDPIGFGLYQRLARDRRIDWLASFSHGSHIIFVGEVLPAHIGRNMRSVPIWDVDILARRFGRRYDRLPYVERNLIPWAWHY